MTAEPNLTAVHKYSSGHRDLLEKSEFAGCFYCGVVFHPAEITEWVDDPPGAPTDLDAGVTALCPRCGIDAVLPSAAPIARSAELLREMKSYWF